MKNIVAGLILALGIAAGAAAQSERVYIQIEAQPGPIDGFERAEAYASALPDVAGYRMETGWYAIALGPFERSDAEAILRSYRAAGQIPRDSFIAFPQAYGERFWPPGVDTPPGFAREAALRPGTAAGADPEPVALAPEEPLFEETLSEARAGEAALSRTERADLQVALEWAGYYSGAIDGLIGPATRRAMAAWQSARAFEATGVLTTAQRAALLREYAAPLEGMDMAPVRDAEAGIELVMPTGVVGTREVAPPFVRYMATTDLEAEVLLISQPGDQSTLFGLYEILQTLEIMPLEGPRERGARSFEINGSDAARHSFATARLEDGAIKGFVLVWPAGDEERRRRVLAEMQAGFRVLPGALPATAGSGAVDGLDLVAGLSVRRPRLSRSGVWIDEEGRVLTSAEATDGCARITLDGDVEAREAFRDAALGVSVLAPQERLAPGAVARFREALPPLRSEIAVAGYSYEGRLGAPTLTFGALAENTGLNGEADVARLSLPTLPGDVGGPVFDGGGLVLGTLLGASDGARRLPEGVQFAAQAPAVLARLGEAGIAARTAPASPEAMAPEDLVGLAQRLTVLVSCWD